jgi:hypothetical protein
MKTAAEHLQWCKDRALQYLYDGDVKNAVASFWSDMDKHEETKISNQALQLLGLQAAMHNDSEAAFRWITGFRSKEDT